MAKDRVQTQAKIQVAIMKVMIEQGERINDSVAMRMAKVAMIVYDDPRNDLNDQREK